MIFGNKALWSMGGIMSREQREKQVRVAALDEKVARMNATAVVATIKEMHLQMAAFKERLDQQAEALAMLQKRFDVEKLLANQLATRGSGPTA
jgi:hypothetical protein